MRMGFKDELKLLKKLLQERDMDGTEQERKEHDQLTTIAKLVHAENRRYELMEETCPYDFSTFLSGILTERLHMIVRKTSEGRYEAVIFDDVLRRKAAVMEYRITWGDILIEEFRFC